MKKLLAMIAIFCAPFAGVQAAGSKGKILLVASSVDSLDLRNGKKMATGFFLNELAIPAQALIEEGYEIVLATPKGNKPAMDTRSADVRMFGNDQAALKSSLDFIQKNPGMRNPITMKKALEQVDQFVAVYIPGGHAPMSDLAQDADLGAILRYFHKTSKPTALLCHGPAALLSALEQASAYRDALIKDDYALQKTAGSGWIYSGYRMTVLSNAEEAPGEKNGQMPYHVADALQTAGGTVEAGALMQSHVVRDRELLTGQNPASDKELAGKLIQMLNEKNG
jgi:putative intracellular protease/amidase